MRKSGKIGVEQQVAALPRHEAVFPAGLWQVLFGSQVEGRRCTEEIKQIMANTGKARNRTVSFYRENA